VVQIPSSPLDLGTKILAWMCHSSGRENGAEKDFDEAIHFGRGPTSEGDSVRCRKSARDEVLRPR
jgi:hypothetical protein